MNVLSLFDGISCGQIALNRANVDYTTYFASEIDKYCIQVTQTHYPNTIQLGNVISLEMKKYNLPNIDLLIGGSPCQSFSSAGTMDGFDGKSKLFWEYVRILNEVKPKYFLLENVVMKSEFKNIITDALGVAPILIDSKWFSAQRRKRLYWTNIPNIILPYYDNGGTVKDILDECVDERFFLSDRAIARLSRNVFTKPYDTIDTDKTGTLLSSYYKTNATGIYFDDGYRKRKYTPTECEKLQTLPPNYTSGQSITQRYKMIGNGWTVDVVAHILSSLNVNDHYF